jgi:hypothetical protein
VSVAGASGPDAHAYDGKRVVRLEDRNAQAEIKQTGDEQRIGGRKHAMTRPNSRLLEEYSPCGIATKQFHGGS